MIFLFYLKEMNSFLNMVFDTQIHFLNMVYDTQWINFFYFKQW